MLDAHWSPVTNRCLLLWNVICDLHFRIVQVADFGLSKQKQQTYVSGVSSSRGTLPWIAPEIIKSPDAVTEKVPCTGVELPGS